MWKENLYQPIEILIREHTVFPIQEHQHSFFEMAYIPKGQGTFYTLLEKGKKETDYTDGSLFLIPPNTAHCFTITTLSQFVFIRFTEHYIADYIGKLAERTLLMNQTFPIELDEHDARIANSLIHLILEETQHSHHFSEHLLQYWANSMIILTTRNLNTSVGPTDPSDDRPAYMVQYIQEHIHQPELLKAEILCKVFNLSPTYIGRYFKRNFQEDLQQYISRNRIRLVKDLLVNSHLTIKEIAYKMGYTDACYLVKVFRKAYGISPLQYRKKRSTGNSSQPTNPQTTSNKKNY